MGKGELEGVGKREGERQVWERNCDRVGTEQREKKKRQKQRV